MVEAGNSLCALGFPAACRRAAGAFAGWVARRICKRPARWSAGSTPLSRCDGRSRRASRSPSRTRCSTSSSSADRTGRDASAARGGALGRRRARSPRTCRVQAPADLRPRLPAPSPGSPTARRVPRLLFKLSQIDALDRERRRGMSAARVSHRPPSARLGPDPGEPRWPTTRSPACQKTSAPGVYRRGKRYAYAYRVRGPPALGTAGDVDEARRRKRQAEADVDRGELVDSRACASATTPASGSPATRAARRTASASRRARCYRQMLEQRVIPYFDGARAAAARRRSSRATSRRSCAGWSSRSDPRDPGGCWRSRGPPARRRAPRAARRRDGGGRDPLEPRRRRAHRRARGRRHRPAAARRTSAR